MRDTLGDFEYHVMKYLEQKSSGDYGLSITRYISEMLDKPISPGAIYTTLSRLENKGMLLSYWSEPTKISGGRKRRYFYVSLKGQEIIAKTDTKIIKLINSNNLG